MRGMRALMSILLLVAMVLPLAAWAEDKPAETPPGMPQMGPPPEMKECDKMVGTWLFKGEFRMSPTDTAWMPFEGTAVFSMACGGAVCVMDYTAPMPGMEMKGMSLTAYDRELKQWQETWIDNISGRISMYTGTYKDGVRIMSGEDIMGGQKMWTRNTSSEMTGTTFKWVMENSMDGTNWFVSMRGMYTKQ